MGRWVHPAGAPAVRAGRRCPKSDDPRLREALRSLCSEERHQTCGYRRIWALLRRQRGIYLNRKTVYRMMRKEHLTRPKIWHRPHRPKRVKKMRPVKPNEAWQIDMTNFVLSDLRPLFLVTVVDCFTREIVGWTLSRRCRASEWVSALRMGLESRGLETKSSCAGLTLRSDNGAQPCSKKFVAYLGQAGVAGEYTGYNAPDDNAYVERVFRTIKEELLWLNQYDTMTEAHAAVEAYMRYYNEERIHSALNYRTPGSVR